MTPPKKEAGCSGALPLPAPCPLIIIVIIMALTIQSKHHVWINSTVCEGIASMI
jgi:hypothetical protein